MGFAGIERDGDFLREFAISCQFAAVIAFHPQVEKILEVLEGDLRCHHRHPSPKHNPICSLPRKVCKNREGHNLKEDRTGGERDNCNSRAPSHGFFLRLHGRNTAMTNRTTAMRTYRVTPESPQERA